MTILRDCVGIPANPRICRSEIRNCDQRIRPDHKIFFIGQNRAVDIAGLMLCDGLLEDLFSWFN
jgi:hypothetical protein